jgi:hypothetical protein
VVDAYKNRALLETKESKEKKVRVRAIESLQHASEGA